VAGIPQNCSITGISVTINMAHTRISDMVLILKAPNGQILNLDYRITGTSNSNLTTGFVNTIISSTSSVALSTGVSPYTGNFKADAIIGAIGGAGTPGPTGMQPTVVNWSSLLVVPNGNWTLGFYDGATGETGILNSWCLSLTHSCTGPTNTTQGVWSPIAGLFINSTATVPYTGNPIDSVWALPISPGTYTYQVTTQSLPAPGCTSTPQSVVVIVGFSSTITTQPTDQNVCLGNNAQFTTTATGVGLSYQWQVTNNGGVTFVNIVNAGIYTGVNSPVLTITQPSLSMSGLRYKVIVSGNNGCVATTSTAALLTVNPLPTVSFYSHPYHLLLPGLSTTLTAVVSPNAAAAYTWFHDGVPVPGATADTLLVDFNNIGIYIRDSALGKMFSYPNPSNGRFQIRLYSEPNKILPRILNVYNNMGTKVLTQSYSQTQSYQQININTKQYGKGIYWVEVLDNNGKRVGLSRVSIQ
jgi:subtilisin-like proprotein convertase family protein